MAFKREYLRPKVKRTNISKIDEHEGGKGFKSAV